MARPPPPPPALKRWRRNVRRVLDVPSRVERELEHVKVLAAEPAVQRIRALRSIQSLADVELRVFSQFGDDGIIQYLVHRLPIAVDTFVEFGVEDYREANTRFLLMRDNWRGFVMDGDAGNVERIRHDDVSWRYDLEARAAFVTRDNVNELIREAGIGGRIGLLHIDIDGNDYWVWEALDAVDPDIAIVEYNAVFGARAPVTVPYDPAFRRAEAHSSRLYWGASLAALAHLAERKSMRFIGCNRAGNNAYFVRASLAEAAALPAPTVAAGYVESRFREARDADVMLSYLRGSARRAAIEEMEVVDVVTGQRKRLRDVP
jgi:hypothetical protein